MDAIRIKLAKYTPDKKRTTPPDLLMVFGFAVFFG